MPVWVVMVLALIVSGDSIALTVAGRKLAAARRRIAELEKQ